MKLFFIFIFIFLGSCSIQKNIRMVPEGQLADPVHIAINDFLYKDPLCKKDTVFSIRIVNSGDSIVAISIVAFASKMLPSSRNKIGTSLPNFPTAYVDSEKKLFYWFDPNHVITSDLISVLSKYKRIDSLNVNGFIGIPSSSAGADDSKKGADYYFCKCDLRRFKKVHSIVAMGYYKPPELNCKCK